jgi:hypothetical protein
VYDFLLTAHLLSAAISFITIAVFSAWAVGVPVKRVDFALSDAAWNISGAGLLIFGIWLALEVDGYELWDGWILAAFGLFALVSIFGARARDEPLKLIEAGSDARLQVTTWHWLRTITLVGILILMVWKPGA